MRKRKDAVGQFFKDAKMQLAGAGGSQWAVTAALPKTPRTGRQRASTRTPRER